MIRRGDLLTPFFHTDIPQSGVPILRARLYWNLWLHQMSFEISFTPPIGTLSFLFSVGPLFCWGIFSLRHWTVRETNFILQKKGKKNLLSKPKRCMKLVSKKPLAKHETYFKRHYDGTTSFYVTKSLRTKVYFSHSACNYQRYWEVCLCTYSLIKK